MIVAPEISLPEIVGRLALSGATMVVRGVTLRVSPAAVVDADLAEAIRRNRDALRTFARLQAPCEICGNIGHEDWPIHNGLSVRRDCGSCGHTKGFPKWTPEADRQAVNNLKGQGAADLEPQP